MLSSLLGEILEACATVYMIEREFLIASNAYGGPPFFSGERMDQWRRNDRAHAGAILRLLVDSQDVTDVEGELRESGRKLYFMAQGQDDVDAEELIRLVEHHRALIDQFVIVAGRALRSGGAGL